MSVPAGTGASSSYFSQAVRVRSAAVGGATGALAVAFAARRSGAADRRATSLLLAAIVGVVIVALMYALDAAEIG